MSGNLHPTSHPTTSELQERRGDGVRSSNLHNPFLLSPFLLPSTLHANSFLASTSLLCHRHGAFGQELLPTKCTVISTTVRVQGWVPLALQDQLYGWTTSIVTQGPTCSRASSLVSYAVFAILKFLIFKTGALHSYCCEHCKLYS